MQEVQSLAESLGIHVEQAKCDVSKQVPLPHDPVDAGCFMVLLPNFSVNCEFPFSYPLHSVRRSRWTASYRASHQTLQACWGVACVFSMHSLSALFCWCEFSAVRSD